MKEDEELDWLKAQIVDTERMVALVGDHCIMSMGLKEKLEELKKELKALELARNVLPNDSNA